MLEEIVEESKAKPKPHEESELISVSEAVKKYRLGRNWLYNGVKTGTLPFDHVKYSQRKIYFNIHDIESWIKLRKIPAGTRPGDIKGGRMKT